MICIVAVALSPLRALLGKADADVEIKALPVERGNVVYTVTEKGELEAVRNTEVLCRVRNKSGTWFATTFKWLIEDGTQVKKGDLLARLEDSTLREQYQTQTIAVTEKRALLIEAQREKEIVESQNHIAIETANNNLKIAEINRKKYIEGDYEQKQKDIQGRIKLARAELKQWEDRFAWSSRMVKAGFISNTQLEAEENKLESARISLARTLEEYRVLHNYEVEAIRLDLESKWKQAEVALKVVRTEAEGKAAKAEANLQAKTTILEQEETKLRELGRDISSCVITAPNDGMVVYFMRESSRSGAGSQRSLLAIGEPVYENQKIMQIPDLRQMQVRLKIHESQQPQLRGDKSRKTQAGLILEAGLHLAAAGWDRLGMIPLAPQLRAAAARDGLLKDEEIVRPGHPAQIKVASADRLLTGQVRWISTVASQLDTLSSDVRVYPTLVTVQTADEDLRPGVSAEVTIFVDERKDVLRLPVHSILELGDETFCYVKAASGLEKRRIETGLNNHRFVEVCAGLQEGELVIENPRMLAQRRGDLNFQNAAPQKTPNKQRGK